MGKMVKSTMQRGIVLIKDGWVTFKQDTRKAFLIGLLAIPAALALALCFVIGISVVVIVIAVALVVFTAVCLALITVIAIVLTGLIFTPIFTAISGIGGRFNRQKRLIVR